MKRQSKRETSSKPHTTSQSSTDCDKNESDRLKKVIQLT